VDGGIPAEAWLVAGGTAPASAQGVRSLLFLIGLAAVSACGDTVAGPSIPLDEPFTLAIGESTTVSGAQFVIEFTGVTGDSRCPADAVCIQGGDALVAVRVSGGGTAATFELHTGDASRASVTHRGYRISLVKLEPYPFSSRPITDAEYRATFAVTRL
jgi:hypothetical protein